MEISLRPYQASGVHDLRQAYAAGFRAPLYVLPTGGGKTFVFSWIARAARERGTPVLILVHRRELLLQASRSLASLGVPHGLIAPGYPMTTDLIQVGSVDTVINRLDKIRAPGLIIGDEGHHFISGNKWGRVIEHYPAARCLFVTATPIRGDGRGLGVHAGGLADTMIIGPKPRALIEMGALSDFEVYAPPTLLDMSGVKKSHGDYNRGDLDKATDKPVITGSAVEHYAAICPNSPAIVFCVSVNHAKNVAAEFRAAGFKFLAIDGTMPDPERKSLIDGLASGKIDGLCTADLIGEGVDIPVVTCAVLLRKTDSLSLYLQQVGRALRVNPGKRSAIILDHVGNVYQHGLPDEEHDWTLDGTARGRGKRDQEKLIPVKQCEKCYHAHRPAPACPACGHVYEVKLIAPKQVDGQLGKVDAAAVTAARRARVAEIKKARTRADLEAVAAARGYNPKWVEHQLKLRAEYANRYHPK